jgi:AraC-like DNA-binding protein
MVASEVSGLISDPLSDIAEGSGVTCAAVERWSFARPFGVRYPGSEHAVVHTVLQGTAVVAGVGEPVRLRTGGAAVLPHDVPHVVASDWPLSDEHIIDVKPEPVAPGTVRNYALSATPDVTIMTMPFIVPGREAVAPTDAAPQVKAVDHPGEDLLELTLLAGKLVLLPGMGQRYVICRLSEAILAKILQRLAGKQEDTLGLFSMFASVGVQAALAAVEADVGRAWTVRELADIAGMPRRAFEAAFADSVGTGVKDFVDLRRVRRAQAALAQGAADLADVAARVGFRSRASLRSAMHRLTGFRS